MELLYAEILEVELLRAQEQEEQSDPSGPSYIRTPININRKKIENKYENIQISEFHVKQLKFLNPQFKIFSKHSCFTIKNCSTPQNQCGRIIHVYKNNI